MKDGRHADAHPGEQTDWQTGWVVRRWERGGHPYPPHPTLCRTVIRRPLESSGLFELYVPLIIHLGRGAVGQAHKDLIYPLAGNERTWQRRAESTAAGPPVKR